MLRKLRMKLADLLVGDDIVLFAPKEVHDRTKLGDYLSMSDQALAANTRRWFHIIDQAQNKHVSQKEKPLQAMLLSHSVLTLFKYLRSLNAETGQFTIRGSVDGGETEQIFRIDAKVLDDYDFGPAGVETEHNNPDDPEAITKLVIRTDLNS